MVSRRSRCSAHTFTERAFGIFQETPCEHKLDTKSMQSRLASACCICALLAGHRTAQSVRNGAAVLVLARVSTFSSPNLVLRKIAGAASLAVHLPPTFSGAPRSYLRHSPTPTFPIRLYREERAVSKIPYRPASSFHRRIPGSDASVDPAICSWFRDLHRFSSGRQAAQNIIAGTLSLLSA